MKNETKLAQQPETAQHTKGPWTAYGTTVCFGEASGSRTAIYDQQICNLHKSPLPDSECRANALLIAAAPELLQALKIAEDMLQQCMKQTHFTLGAVGNMAKIGEILAKAGAA